MNDHDIEQALIKVAGEHKKRYVGDPDSREVRVIHNGKSKRLRKRKLDGEFCWGYGGSGPKALASALLFDACGIDVDETDFDDKDHVGIHALRDAIKWELVGHLPMDKPFNISAEQVIEVVQRAMARQAKVTRDMFNFVMGE